MNAVSKIEAEAVDPLAKMREEFPDNLISKLPKESKAQIDERKTDRSAGVNCKVCGSWHHKNAVHLDYVGHAALTDRLLDTDPHWTWEPVAFRDGLPAFDSTGGLWIKLTVCGVTRLGYGHAAAKPNMDPGAREKEVIGDALRNAAMRFGAALELWHKGDLHAHRESEGEPNATAEELATQHLRSCAIDKATFAECWAKNKANWRDVLDDEAYAHVVSEMKRLGKKLADEEAKAKTPHERAVEALADDTIQF